MVLSKKKIKNSKRKDKVDRKLTFSRFIKLNDKKTLYQPQAVFEQLGYFTVPITRKFVSAEAREVVDWLFSTFDRGSFSMTSDRAIAFCNAKDALLFKLTWL